MNKESQRIKIAEVCGWKPCHKGCDGRTWRLPDDSGCQPHLPDYLSDLNAMHEAEKTLTPTQCNDYDTHIVYRVRKSEINPPANRWKFHATAAQRAESFLKTLNLWTDS